MIYFLSIDYSVRWFSQILQCGLRQKKRFKHYLPGIKTRKEALSLLLDLGKKIREWISIPLMKKEMNLK